MLRTCLLLLALLVIVATGAKAEIVYRWVDGQGTVHYSAQPSPVYPSTAVDVGSGDAKEIEAKREAAAVPASAEDTRYCNVARQNLAALESGQDITRTDEYGVTKLLSEAEKQQEIERAHAAMTRYCPPQ